MQNIKLRDDFEIQVYPWMFELPGMGNMRKLILYAYVCQCTRQGGACAIYIKGLAEELDTSEADIERLIYELHDEKLIAIIGYDFLPHENNELQYIMLFGYHKHAQK